MQLELLKWLITITLQWVYVLEVMATRIVHKPQPRCSECGGILVRLGTVDEKTVAIDSS